MKNNVFLITGSLKGHMTFASQWFSNRVARVYGSLEEAKGGSIYDLPVAVMISDKDTNVVETLSSSLPKKHGDLIHIHFGPRKSRKMNGADTYHHIKVANKFDCNSLDLLREVEAVWRAEKTGKANGRSSIKLPI